MDYKLLSIIGLIFVVLALLSILSYQYYKTSILPNKSHWFLLKTYAKYSQSFSNYILMLKEKGIESIPITIDTGQKFNLLIGIFILKHGANDTYIKHMAVTSHVSFGTPIFQQYIGKVETMIFIKNPKTVIHYNVPCEQELLIEILHSLGYKKLRINYSTDRVEMVKSKIMN